VILIDTIDRGVRVAPDAPCLVRPDGTVDMTHAEFHRATHQIAAGLIAAGIGPGDRVGVLSPNDPRAFAAVVGVIRAGATWVAVNYMASDSDTSDFLNLTGCSALIHHEHLADKAAAIVADVPSLRTVIVIGQAGPGQLTLDDWLAAEPAVVPSAGRSEDVVMLTGTGGTTGRPKGVPITSRQMVQMCLAFSAHLHEPEPPRYLCATPMTHAAGVMAFPVLAEGGAVIVHAGVKAEEIFDSIERNRVSRTFLPPTALYALLGHPEVRNHDYSSLRHFAFGAAPIAPERLAEAVEVFGPVMAQVFGQTEAPMLCTYMPPQLIAEAAADPQKQHRLASCGLPSLVARVEIMDDDGNLLGPGERGEIVVRGELVFSGYWQNPEATAETTRPGGWHGTGDVGLRDQDGFVYIVDRKKDLIISGGFNVFPSEVEAVIHALGTVNDCAVIGLPDDKWGEVVTAVVEPKAGETVDPDRVIARCKERLGSVKAPKQVFIQELPRSANGKVLKRELRDAFWASAGRAI
jgi:acyl-CoA synthetase (AMP-forming)/AMP-acid ligase II